MGRQKGKSMVGPPKSPGSSTREWERARGSEKRNQSPCSRTRVFCDSFLSMWKVSQQEPIERLSDPQAGGRWRRKCLPVSALMLAHCPKERSQQWEVCQLGTPRQCLRFIAFSVPTKSPKQKLNSSITSSQPSPDTRARN